jgi:soluble lytic murein transglycosylase
MLRIPGFLLLVVYLLSSGCKPSLWGFTWRDLTEAQTTDGSIPAAGIDLEALQKSGRLAELDRLGPGASWCLARLLEKDDLGKALFLYRHEAENGRPLWRRESLFRMVVLYDETENHDEVLLWGWKSRLEFPDDKRILPFLIKSSFIEGRYQDIPGLLSDMPEPGPESLLYGKVALAVIDKKNTAALMDEAVYGLPLNHGYRIIIPVLEKEGILQALPAPMSDYLKGRVLMLDRDYGRALSLVEPALTDPRLSETRPLIFEDYRLIRSGMPGKTAGADKLLLLAEGLQNPPSRRLAAMGAARLYRLDEKPEKGEPAARMAVEASSPGKERDEPLWQLLRAILDTDVPRFVDELMVSDMDDPEYFEDLFESCSVKIVQERLWILLPALWNKAEASGSATAKNHVAWVTLLAVHYGFLPDTEVPVQELKTWLLNNDRWGYRGLMTGWLFKSGAETGWNPLAVWAGATIKKTEEPPKNGELTEFFESLIKFGLADVAYREAMLRYEETPVSALRKTARFLSDEGLHYETIRVLSRFFYEDWYRPDAADINLLYPMAYRELVESAAGEFTIDVGLVFSVIRTESAFKADIVSHAGAMGLMQLMPATAEERAGALKISDPDVTDPQTNIRMGTSHILWLFERDWTTCPMDIMISYNAGGGNLRKWRARYEGLPPLLLAEALPPKETRDYIRKNLLALIVYNYYYFHKDPELIITTFFGM